VLKYYYQPSPNPAKAALFFEEAALPCELAPIDTRKGEQFNSVSLAINQTPNLRRSPTALLWCSTATRSFCTSRRSRGSFYPRALRGARGAFVMAHIPRQRRRPLFGSSRALQTFSIPSSIWQCGAERAWCRSFWQTTRGRKCRTRGGSLMRSASARPPCTPTRSKTGTLSRQEWMKKRVATCFRRT